MPLSYLTSECYVAYDAHAAGLIDAGQLNFLVCLWSLHLCVHVYVQLFRFQTLVSRNRQYLTDVVWIAFRLAQLGSSQPAEKKIDTVFELRIRLFRTEHLFPQSRTFEWGYFIRHQVAPCIDTVSFLDPVQGQSCSAYATCRLSLIEWASI